MEHERRAAADVVRAVLQCLAPPLREVAPGEFGTTLEDVGGWPLEVGVRVADGLVRAQAEALGPGAPVDLHALLHRNRLVPLVRYAHSAAGALHVHADLPAAGVTPAALDRALALLVEAAEWARDAAR